MRRNLASLLAIWTSHITTAYTSPDNSQCVTSPLAKPVSQLKSYGSAQTYCSQQYPATTVTRTSCTTTPTSTPKRRNAAAQPPTINDGNNLNDSNNARQAAFTSLQNAPSSTQKSICQCISSPTTITITTTCPSTTTCDSQTGTCIPTRNCNNPARCDSSSYCLESSTSGACFCHPDTDDPSLGYCLSGGGGCPEVYEDCESNADCGGGERVCILACCREEPFCVDLREYDPEGGNGSLSRRGVNGEAMGLNPI